jgi:hypothetical protein
MRARAADAMRRRLPGSFAECGRGQEPAIAANEWAFISTATTRLAHPRRHVTRPRTCTAAVGKPRSTPEWACFTILFAAITTSAAREVTLYLALASPSSFRPRSSGPAASSSLTLRPARRRFPAGPVLGPSEHHPEWPVRVQKTGGEAARPRSRCRSPDRVSRGPPPGPPSSRCEARGQHSRSTCRGTELGAAEPRGLGPCSVAGTAGPSDMTLTG